MPVTLTAPAQLPSWPKNAAPGAEDALGVLLVVDREAEPPGRGQVVQQGVNVGDGVRGARGQPGLRAQTRRTSGSVIVDRMALPAAEAYGTSRWPSGV